MNLQALRTSPLATVLLLIMAVAACSPLASPFSEQAYRNATAMKARSLSLVARSGEPFVQHGDDVQALLTDIDAAYEYAKGLPRNEVVTEQWRLIRDPDAGLVGSFASEWARKGAFGATFRQDYAEEIAFAFDTVICVEITKKSAADCNNKAEGQ